MEPSSDEQPHGRGYYVDLEGEVPGPEIAEPEGYSPSIGEVPPQSNESSQPENEMFPPESDLKLWTIIMGLKGNYRTI